MKVFLSVAIFIFLSLGLSGCMTVPIESSSVPPLKSKLSKNKKIPSADGKIVVTSTLNNSNQVDLLVKHLALPRKISPRAKTYIVWEVPTGSSMKPQSLGALKLDKNYTGRLTTVTPFRSFDIFITAEPSLSQVEPSGEKLLWITVTR